MFDTVERRNGDSIAAGQGSLIGYTDRLSVAPGGVLRVMVSCEDPAYTAQVVRLGGAKPVEISLDGNGTHPGRVQIAYAGSYAHVPSSPIFSRLSALTVHAWVYPTIASAGRRQGIVSMMAGESRVGWVLLVDEQGCLRFEIHGTKGAVAVFASTDPLRPRSWYQVAGFYDQKTGRGGVRWKPVPKWETGSSLNAVEARVESWSTPDAPVLIGSGFWTNDPKPHAEEHFDGKVENPTLFDRVLDDSSLDERFNSPAPKGIAAESVLASWDFSQHIGSRRIIDTSANRLDGTLVNMPARGVTGHNWNGRYLSFSEKPEEYAAIHFHSDDLDDAGWEPDFDLTIPRRLASGVYAVRLTSNRSIDYLPFYVLPERSSSAKAVFIAPTFTYLAYADKHSRIGLSTTDAYCCLRPHDQPTDAARDANGRDRDPTGLFLNRHPELGLSLYDYHHDGSGCCFASRLRPLPEMRPDHRHPGTDDPRHFSADLLTIEWLDRKGFSYDVITDEDLHNGGAALLAGYSVAITGSHPEYCSLEMWDALNDYVIAGGNLMYLGGNGFYWVTSLDEEGHTIEVRRGIGGTRPWSSDPGEQHHTSTGELGGLWRYRGRAPNALVGVGFASVGGTGASGYTRQPGSQRPEVQFIFRGVPDGELIGDFGSIDGGAAGDEVDRLDPDLGSPQDAIVLASALDLNEGYKITIEDLNHTIRDQTAPRNPRIRSDMVYFRRGAGAVFSVGSINWSGSLGYNNDDNNVSQITRNVIDHFLAGSANPGDANEVAADEPGKRTTLT